MLHQLLVLLHLMGAAVWIGGHVVLVRVVLPSALRQNDPQPVLEFERGFGKISLGALALQVGSGVWLAHQWLGGWSHLFDWANPASHLVLVKLGLLVTTLVLAGHAYHRVLPRLTPATMRRFAVHAWLTTILAILMLIAGASIRMGGPL